jgi:tetratricopeptide (TPR) repeat protein
MHQGLWAKAAACARGIAARFESPNRRVVRLLDAGRYAEAAPLAEQAVAEALEKNPNHRNTAKSLNNLGEVYRNLGRFDEAEPLYHQALAIDEETIGPEHPDTATDLNNLAKLYAAQGRLAEAEPCYTRAVAIRTKRLGPDHAATVQSRGELEALRRARADQPVGS